MRSDSASDGLACLCLKNGAGRENTYVNLLLVRRTKKKHELMWHFCRNKKKHLPFVCLSAFILERLPLVANLLEAAGPAVKPRASGPHLLERAFSANDGPISCRICRLVDWNGDKGGAAAGSAAGAAASRSLSAFDPTISQGTFLALTNRLRRVSRWIPDKSKQLPHMFAASILQTSTSFRQQSFAPNTPMVAAQTPRGHLSRSAAAPSASFSACADGRRQTERHT